MGLRYVRRKRGTCRSGKIWYASRLEALAARQFMADSFRSCRAYRCNLCNGWHITSQERRQTGERPQQERE